MISELDRVILTRDLPHDGLKAGDIGIIVLLHSKGAAYEVEFADPSGDTLAVVTVPVDAVRAVNGRGDYTAERERILGNPTVKQLVKELRRRS